MRYIVTPTPLELALEFYANRENYEDQIVRPLGRDSYFASAAVMRDKGKLAAAALADYRTALSSLGGSER